MSLCGECGRSKGHFAEPRLSSHCLKSQVLQRKPQVKYCFSIVTRKRKAQGTAELLQLADKATFLGFQTLRVPQVELPSDINSNQIFISLTQILLN